MKNKVKLFGIIVFITVIGFAITACDDGIKPDLDVVGATLRLYDKPVTVDDSADECTATDFAFIIGGPLSEFISGTPEANLVNGKLTIKLDTPNPERMGTLSDFFEYSLEGIDIFNSGLTANPSLDEVLCFGLYRFFESEGKYYLKFEKEETYDLIFLIYVDKNVTINGTTVGSEPFEDTFDNVILYQGWNYLIGIVDDDGNYTFTSKRSEPSGYTWTLFWNDLS